MSEVISGGGLARAGGSYMWLGREGPGVDDTDRCSLAPPYKTVPRDRNVGLGDGDRGNCNCGLSVFGEVQ